MSSKEREFGHCVIRSPRMMTAVWLLAAGIFGLMVPMTAAANGLRENDSWQFETSLERAQKGAVLDLIQRKRAGTYTSTTNNNFSSTYNIAGHYIDCNMTSQASGNQGSASQTAPIASPSIDISSDTSATATGNTGKGTVTAGGDTSNTGLAEQTGDNDTATSSSTTGGTNSITTTQHNDGSTQNSSADGNSFGSTISGISGSGGEASVALNSNQSLDDSPISSSISGSSACDFNVAAGNIGSPINDGGL